MRPPQLGRHLSGVLVDGEREAQVLDVAVVVAEQPQRARELGMGEIGEIWGRSGGDVAGMWRAPTRDSRGEMGRGGEVWGGVGRDGERCGEMGRDAERGGEMGERGRLRVEGGHVVDRVRAAEEEGEEGGRQRQLDEDA